LSAAGSLVIRNCDALIGGVVVSSQDIHVVAGVITAIGPTSAQSLTGDVDAAGLMAMPGFINSHTHAAMTLLRGAVEDVAVESWFNDHIWPIEVNVTADDVQLGTELACAEMIQAGVTSFADHYFHADRAAAAVINSGLRANLGMTFFSSQGPAGLETSASFAADWNDAAGGRITTSLAPHATYTCDDADLSSAAEAARTLGVRVHLHAAETVEQTESSLAARGITPIQVLADTGVLDAGVLIAHGCGIVPDDLALLAPFADRIGVAHCPKTYMKLATNPLTPIDELRSAGIAVGLGTDGPASCNSIDLFENMRLTALAQKFIHRDATRLGVSQALAMAGPESARAIGSSAGRLAVGAPADIILVDLSGLHCQPLHNPLAALVYSARASDVQTTIVDGIPLMVDRELLTVDAAELSARVAARAPQLLDHDPTQSIQTYGP
jgi:cytosine/adenosine deaminase-related metal-dependent hydrolase